MTSKGKILRNSIVVIFVLAIVGAVYEKIGERRDRSRYPQIGRSVDIGGRSLNISCSGEGSPTVILEPPGHTAGYGWIAIQPEVAKFTRACWYDRAGYGWSDPAPSPRTFQEIAKDLHALLQAGGVPGPYVMVGATAGAFHVRVYNGLYPDEVAGAVLVHASDPDLFAHEPAYMKGGLGSLPPALQSLACHFVAPVLVRLGVIRLFGNPGAGRPFGMANLNPAQQQELRFLSNNPSTMQTEGEGCVLDESQAEVRKAGDFGSHPLVVLVNSTPMRAPEPRYQQAAAEFNDYWFHQLQPRLAALSTRGRLVAAEDAERPSAIVAAIHDVVSEVRLQHVTGSGQDRSVPKP